MSALVGALDIGGTHVSAGLVDPAARTVVHNARLEFSTGDDADLPGMITGAAVAAIRAGVQRLGVAVPGPFDYTSGRSRIEHKLRGLYDVDLRAELAAALALEESRVRFLNDAEAFLLGEWWAGAARGHGRVVGITLGTGLGSAFLSGGRIVREGTGVPDDGELFRVRFRGAPVEDSISSRGVLARLGGSSVAEVAQRAREGEAAGCRAFAELGRALAEFLTPWLRAFEPSCLVVGGSIARSWELFERELRGELRGVESLESVTVAERLDDAALLGAAWHAQGSG